MPKTPLPLNVLEAAQQRIEWTFDNFSRIYLSFSGGKDSTVMLHLTMMEAQKRNRTIGVLFVDLEGQYKLTIDHIQNLYTQYADHIDPYWVALPIHLRNAVSVYEPFWKCWDPQAKDAWIRQPPPQALTDLDHLPFFQEGMEFEEFTPEFGAWYAQGQRTACLVGIRTDESLNRFRALSSTTKTTYQDQLYTTLIYNSLDAPLYNVYPIYDWKTEDIWAYHGKHPHHDYNQLYNLMHKAGLTPHQQRICQPYGDDQRRGLWLFHLIEPETWARVVARVNGANTGALYAQEHGNINGYRRVSKPPGHTYESFARLLLDSMPAQTKTHYENKLLVWLKYWTERGYPDSIPDEAPYELETYRKVPSWRRVVKALLRNDYWFKGMGFSQTKSDAYQKYLDLMNRRRTADHWQQPLKVLNR